MKKKISQIISFTVLAVVVLAVVLCAVIKLDFMPQMRLPVYPEVIQITDSEANARTLSLTGEDFDKFVTTFNDGFKMSVLSALFSGKLGASISTPKKVTSTTKSGYVVVFMYNEEQELTDNGEPVKTGKQSTETVKFTRVMFSIQAEKGLNEETSLYFYKDTTSYYQITTLANFDSLYEFITNLSMFAE